MKKLGNHCEKVLDKVAEKIALYMLFMYDEIKRKKKEKMIL